MPLDHVDLLAELGWLRRLARSLVGPVGADEDIVQETWLAASRVEGGVSRAWLVSTLRNLAASWHRRESRLRGREVAVARPEAVDADSLVERTEWFGVVLGELRKLNEPYRTTLLLIYQEELSVSEAAERLSIPVDTLRWQRREGLARLRQQLDRESGAGRGWRAAFLPLLGLPSMDLAKGTGAIGAGVKTAALMGGVLMTWKLTTATIVAGLAIVSAFLFLGGDHDRLTIEPTTVDSPEQQSVALTPRLREPVTHGEEPREAQTPARQRQPLAFDPVPLEGPTLAVAVIDESNQPARGARVWVGDTPDPEGGVWESNEQGIALIPLPESDVAYISSSTATHYGQSIIFPAIVGGETSVRLFPDADVTVLIVDGAGNPVAGVPVSRGAKLFDSAKSSKTNSEGLAVLRHVLDHFKFASDSSEFRVGPAILSRERLDVVLHKDHVPSEPVRIVLPPTGSLDVLVLDADGSPNHTAGEVRLVIDPAPGTDRSVPELVELAQRAPLGALTVQLTDGTARVPFIGLGLELLAESRDAEPTKSTFGFAAGPETASARTELTLRPLDVAPMLVGMAHAANGTALAHRKLEGKLSIHSGDAWESSSFEVSTGADGGFELVVDRDLSSNWTSLRKRSLSLTIPGSGPFDVSRSTPTLPDQLVPGPNDLGIVLFEREVPFLTGHELNSNGEAVQLDTAHLVIKVLSDAGRARGVFGTRLVQDDNAFAFFGTTPALDAQLDEVLEAWVWVDGLPKTYKLVLPGDRDVEFVFDEGGSLSGIALVEPSDSAISYYAEFRATDASGVRRSYGKEQLALNGRFDLSGLPLTVGDVVIGAFGTKTVMAKVFGVMPGSDSEDQAQRLHSIRLRNAPNEFALHVLDEAGTGLPGATFESASLEEPIRSYAGGYLFWRADEESVTGVLSAPGFRSEELVLPPGERVVNLRHGPEIIVQPGTLPALPSDASLVVRLRSTGHAEEDVLTPLTGGRYSGFVSGAGEYEVRGQILQRAVPLADLPFSDARTARVIVTDRAGVQEFRVPLDRAAFEALVPAK